MEPLEALGSIQSIGTGDAASDFDGNGVVTPLEALSAIQRIGYIRNNSVVGDTPGISSGVESSATLPQSVSVSPSSVNPVLAGSPETTSPKTANIPELRPENSPLHSLVLIQEDDDDDLFGVMPADDESLMVTATRDDGFSVADECFEDAADWLNVL